MNCPRPETLAGYLDGELSTEETGWLREHLAVCEACRRRLVRIAESARLGKAALEDAESGSCPDWESLLAAAETGDPGEWSSHLASCPRCAARYREAEAVIALVEDVEAGKGGSFFREEPSPLPRAAERKKPFGFEGETQK